MTSPPPYDAWTDSQLRQATLAGDDDAYAALEARYWPLIRSLATQPIPGLDRDDIEQELRMKFRFRVLTMWQEQGDLGAWAKAMLTRSRQKLYRHHTSAGRDTLAHAAGPDAMPEPIAGPEHQPDNFDALNLLAQTLYRNSSPAMRLAWPLLLAGVTALDTRTILADMGFDMPERLHHGIGQTRAAIEQAKPRGQDRPVVQVNPATMTAVAIYPSAKAAAHATGARASNICHVLKGRLITTAGFAWRYLTDAQKVSPDMLISFQAEQEGEAIRRLWAMTPKAAGRTRSKRNRI